jgi:glycerophosphoryl diester phosphodiesterase
MITCAMETAPHAAQVLGGGPVLPLVRLLAEYREAYFAIDIKDPAAIAPLAVMLREYEAAGRVCAVAARGSWLVSLRRQAGAELRTALSWRALARLASTRTSRCVSAA